MNRIAKIIKPEIRNLKRTQDTFDDRYDYLRLDKNERLLPFPKKKFSDFKKKILFKHFSGYPELNLVYKKLSKFLKINNNQLLITSGADLAIKSIYEACINKYDEVILPSPCYSMNIVYAKMFGAKILKYNLNFNWNIYFPDIAALISRKTKMVVIENPNGFIGTSPNAREIIKLASYLKKKNILLVLDEAYIYVKRKKSIFLKRINKLENLLIIQTFSKAQGLAGMRFGYIAGNQKIMKYIKNVRPAHEISNLTSLAANWILDNKNKLIEFQLEIKKSKFFLKTELNKLNLTFRLTDANFLLIKFKIKINKILKDKKILVRRPFEEKFLKGWSRVAIGSLKDSKKFIERLKEIY